MGKECNMLIEIRRGRYRMIYLPRNLDGDGGGDGGVGG